MSQEPAIVSRAISTAAYLMAAPPETQEKKVWDAAHRHVILIPVPVSVGPDTICVTPPGQHASLRSFLGTPTSLSGRIVRFDSAPTNVPGSPAVPSPCSNQSSRKNSSVGSLRASLTGYQWNGISPTADTANATSWSRNSSVDSPVSVLEQHSPGSCSSPVAATAVGEGCKVQEPRQTKLGRRYSLQLPLSPSQIRQLHHQVCSMNGSSGSTEAAAAAAMTSEASAGAEGLTQPLRSSLRRSQVGFHTAAAPSVLSSKAGATHSNSINGNMGRRSRSLELQRTQPDVQHHHHSCSAASLAAIRTGDVTHAALAAGSVVPGLRQSCGARTAKASRKSAVAAAPAGGATSPNVGSSVVDSPSVESGSETSRFVYKPFVPPIDVIDKHALAHAAEADCTAYGILLSMAQQL